MLQKLQQNEKILHSEPVFKLKEEELVKTEIILERTGSCRKKIVWFALTFY